MNTRVLLHWPLMGHQGLNPTVHEIVHQPSASESLLLQRSNRLKKILHLALEPCLHTIVHFSIDTSSPLVKGGVLLATFLV
jgi:hypothetical protein